MAIIELNELSRVYGFGDATNVALDEVSLSIEPGEFVAVMGPSGCGKSTLMNIIGLLDKPSHGSYKLNNHEATRLSVKKRARRRRDDIGFIFQSYNLLPRLTAIENVALPLAYKGVSQTRRLKLASSLLERVGLKEREYYFPRQLSGGQAQCVAIARALINDPHIIIADEPTGNLDSTNSRLVMELLSEIHNSGNTILFVTHNPELTRYANRVLYMRDGAVAFDDFNKLGQVARRAEAVVKSANTKTEEDILEGVSVIMHSIPGSTKEVAKIIDKKRSKSKPHSKSKSNSKTGKTSRTKRPASKAKRSSSK